MKHLNWKSFFKGSDEDFDVAEAKIQSFFEQTPAHLEALQEAIQLQHAGAVESSAHSLKTLLEPYGAWRIVAKASELEAIGGRGEIEAASGQLSELRGLLDELYEDLQIVLRKKPSRKASIAALGD